jgi:phosphoribosylglycinamide formyltransferase 1
MAKLAVLASGNGSNFEALVLATRAAGHQAVLLVCDRPGAFVLQRAARLGVPDVLVLYTGNPNTGVSPAGCDGVPAGRDGVPTDRSGPPPEMLRARLDADRARLDADRARLDAEKVRQQKDKIICRLAAEARITSALEEAGADLVALAGFMRLLSPAFVARWQGRLVNIHPSLLPAYPGTEAIRRAWEAGEPLLGVTVHYVDEGMDTGPVLARVEVARQDSLEATEQAIHEAEHQLYARVIVGLLDSAGAGPCIQFT